MEKKRIVNEKFFILVILVAVLVAASTFLVLEAVDRFEPLYVSVPGHGQAKVNIEIIPNWESSPAPVVQKPNVNINIL